MALNFPNASLLGLTQESRFFDAGFNYSQTKRLTINGLVSSFSSTFGITGVWTGAEGMINTVKNNPNFQPLVVNGVSFGSGRIQSYAFAPGLDVKLKTYTAELVVFETGNLFNLTGSYYSGIDSSSFQYLQRFDEDFNFNRKENGGYGYTHNASVQFNSGVGNLNAIQSAQVLAKTLFTGANLGFAFYSGFTNKQGKRFYRESYNLIDNGCSFDETFDFDSNSGSYSVTRTNRYDINDAGIITINENAQIAGIVSPTFQSALAAVNTEMVGAYDRCNALFTLYAPANAFTLITSPVVQSRTFDLFQNSFAYTLSFSNDITNSGLYFWNYSQQITYADEVARLSENGSILGRGRNYTESYNNAVSGFVILNASAPGRASNFYAQNVGSSANVFLDTQERRYSPFKGEIDYTYNYSNEVLVAATGGVKRIDIVTQDSSPNYLYSAYNIVNYKEIIQDGQNATVGRYSLNLNMIGVKSIGLDTYLENAKTAINARIPTGQDAYITEASYSYNPNDNQVGVIVGWNYYLPASKTISVI